MCGIVGYVGDKQAAPILLAGLSKLEYRGYDRPDSRCGMARNWQRLLKQQENW